VVRAAVQTALEAAEPAMVQPYRARAAEALACAIADLAPGNLSHGVLTTSGAEAVEAAIKLVRAHTGRARILSATGSFHGKTMGALALTGQRQHAEGFGPQPAGFDLVQFGNAEALASRLERDGERIAAFFLEPIQGERGVILPPPGYLARVRELCSRHGVLLVLDEIQTGLGRTGRLFACEHEGVTPDVLLIGKALGGGLFPLSGCFTSATVWNDRFALGHSSTFANNNVAARVGLAVLDVLTRGGLCEEVARKGERLLGGLRRLATRYPRVIADVRGRGLMCAIELCPPSAKQSSLLSYLTHQGLYAYAVAAAVADTASVLVLPTLGTADILRVTPPLVMTDQELDIALTGLESVCRAMDRDATGTLAAVIGAPNAPGLDGEVRDSSPAPLLSVRMPAAAPVPHYAFLIHPTCLEDVTATNPALSGLTDEALRRFCARTSNLAPGLLLCAPAIRSTTGAVAEGVILVLPLLPEEMARRGLRRVAHDIGRAVDLAASLGARVVGLGGFTTPYSRRGLAVIGRGPAITTGNALTAGMALAATRRAAAARGLLLAAARVAVVGARGSVGALCARLFAREGVERLVLVGNPEAGPAGLSRLQRELSQAGASASATTDLAALLDSDIILTATAAARPVLAGVAIAPGTIICDVARPPDVPLALRTRRDVTIIEGGRVALPDPTICFGPGNLQNLPAGVTFACLAETILLGLEGDPHDHGIGDDIALVEVDRMMARAERHGFRLPTPPASEGYAEPDAGS
jgi:acetylornithine/succinyldiaminopimelate/putrescine aminotransferase/predicted amino acid dehydrogenase